MRRPTLSRSKETRSGFGFVRNFRDLQVVHLGGDGTRRTVPRDRSCVRLRAQKMGLTGVDPDTLTADRGRPVTVEVGV